MNNHATESKLLKRRLFTVAQTSSLNCQLQLLFFKSPKMEQIESPDAKISVIIECEEGNHTHGWSIQELVDENKKVHLENQKLRETKGKNFIHYIGRYVENNIKTQSMTTRKKSDLLNGHKNGNLDMKIFYKSLLKKLISFCS